MDIQNTDTAMAALQNAFQNEWIQLRAERLLFAGKETIKYRASVVMDDTCHSGEGDTPDEAASGAIQKHSEYVASTPIEKAKKLLQDNGFEVIPA